MEKLITYKESEIKNAIELINKISVSGIQNCKIISIISQILEEGVSAEIKKTKSKEGD